MKKLFLGLMALALFTASPAFATDSCACNESCRKACIEGSSEACGCQHCDCSHCQCE